MTNGGYRYNLVGMSHMTDGMWSTTGEYDVKRPTVWASCPDRRPFCTRIKWKGGFRKFVVPSFVLQIREMAE